MTVLSPELVLLAHTLAVPTERLAFLDGVPDAGLRELRTQAGDALFAQDRHHFHRLGGLATAVPPALSARIVRLAIPPLVAAMTAQVIDPTKAAAMVARLPVGYLADVSAAIDPDRAAELIAGIAPNQVAAVAAELARRHEWIVIGGFASQVDAAGLAASVAQFDGAQLLHISYVMSDRSRVDEITDLLTNEQLDDLLAAAAQHGLWAEGAELLHHLSPAHRPRLQARFAAAGDEVRAAYFDAVRSQLLDPAAFEVLGIA